MMHIHRKFLLDDFSPLRKRKTNRYGFLIKRGTPFAGVEATVSRNQEVGRDIIDTIEAAAEGKSIRLYGKVNGVEKELVIKKSYRMGKTIYLTKTGTEVELYPSGAGLQVINTQTRRVLLDKGNDMIFESTHKTFSQFLTESKMGDFTIGVLEYIEDEGREGVDMEELLKKFHLSTVSRKETESFLRDILNFWEESGELIQTDMGVWKLTKHAKF